MTAFLTPELLCLFMFITAIGLLLAGFPVAFTLSGTAAIFALIGNSLGLFDLTLLTAFPQRVFGTMNSEVLVAVPLFVFMGVMLERSRVAEELLDNMGKAFGALPGGLGYSVCLVGALLAASTGIVGATVVTMGLLSLPIMLKRGYSKPLACGTIAASGTLGQIIPPSIVLVLLGSQLSIAYQNAQFAMGSFSPDTVSVNDLFAGALIPGLALVGMYIVYQIIHSLLRPGDAPPIPRAQMNEEERRKFRRHLLKALFAPIILIITVLGSILGGLATPTEAAAVGAVGAMMLAGHRIDERRGWPILLGALCLAGLLFLTHFIDLRMQRDSVSIVEKAGFVLAIVMTGGLIWGVLTAAWRTYRFT
ncbi:MAG TPA: TRAP transporter large permease subunit, partial [Rhodobacteraceae bacterium]|nr:TRAP transporter large permease subunit [Paracoccaceae bacterium]